MHWSPKISNLAVLTSRLLKQHGDEGAEVALLVGEGVVVGGEAPARDVLHGSDVLHVGGVLSLAGHPYGVGFWLAGLGERRV